MADVLKKIFSGADEINQTYVINAWHVSQSIDAFTGEKEYDITLSGSFMVTGSTLLSGSTTLYGTPAIGLNDSSVLLIDSTTGQIKTGSAISSGDTLLLVSQTGSFVETASLSGNVLTFTEGDGTTFDLTLDTGSYLTTASIAGNITTFTKGDGTTFDLTLDTGSYIITASNIGSAITFETGDQSSFVLNLPDPSSGTSGTSGDDGSSGTSGTPGSSGTSGTSAPGTSGEAGSSGTSGTPGSSGTSGTSFQGTSGQPGSSGTSGTSAPGTSGEAGSSGTSGDDGDRFASTSGDSFSIPTTATRVALTIETDLAWTPGQQAVIAYDADNKFESTVYEYTASTGDFVVSSSTPTYSSVGPYSSWTINTTGAPGQQGDTGPAGSSGTSGQSHISSNAVGNYTFEDIDYGDPASGKIALQLGNDISATTFNQVQKIRIHEYDNLGNDLRSFISGITTGSYIRVENATQGGSTNFVAGFIVDEVPAYGASSIYTFLATAQGGMVNVEGS